MSGLRPYACQNPRCRWQGWLKPSHQERESAPSLTEPSDDLWQTFEDRVVNELNSEMLPDQAESSFRERVLAASNDD